jgi:hypothetical protein
MYSCICMYRFIDVYDVYVCSYLYLCVYSFVNACFLGLVIFVNLYMNTNISIYILNIDKWTHRYMCYKTSSEHMHTIICNHWHTCMCVYIYVCMYVYINIHTHIHMQVMRICTHRHTAHSRPHGRTYTRTHLISDYMPDARFNVCACSHLRRIQLAIHTLPAMTNTSHMHTKPSATCHYSQPTKRREVLEHALRQTRDLVVVETPAQAHTGWEWWSGCLTRARSASWRAPSEACSWHTCATNGA